MKSLHARPVSANARTRAPVHRLFFALRPDAAVADAIRAAGQSLRAAANVGGRWLAPEKHHITLLFIGDFRDRVPDRIADARAAGARIRQTPFDICLDRAESFRRHRQPPLVLRCSAESEARLDALYRLLATAASPPGAGGKVSRYVPHLTLAYGDAALPRALPIEPITWRIDAFVLIDSLVGTSTHRILAHWPLQ